MTNLEYYRHEIAYCMDVGEGMGIINNRPMVCGFGACRSCIAGKSNEPKTDEVACDTEKIIDWMLAEHKEESDAEC